MKYLLGAMSLSTSPNQLDTTEALKIIASNGILSQRIRGFESRPQQQQMLNDVIEAYNASKIAIIEAGTGTGKSIAYLIPALLWALQMKERTVISTNTINLQEQLLHKDIPTLCHALSIDIKATIVKGMSNYLCLRKLEDTRSELQLLSGGEVDEFNRIDAWNDATADGSRSDLPFHPTYAMWEKVCVESDTCNREKCPYYHKCHFFKARREAADAQILISNHSLLFSDLSYRAETDNYKGAAILPAYTHIILDEAHNIEDIATDHFAAHCSTLQFLRILGRMTAEKQGKVSGKLPMLRAKVASCFDHDPPKEVTSILSRLATDLPAMRHEVVDRLIAAFDAFIEFIESAKPQANEESQPGESKLRLLPQLQEKPTWSEEVLPRCKELLDAARRFVQSTAAIESDIQHLNNEHLNEQTVGLRLDITALAGRLQNACNTLESFIQEKIPSNCVRWMMRQQLKTMTNIGLFDAELDISRALVNHLFTKFPTIVLCSATLTTNKKFDFFRSRLGLTEALLPEKEITESIYDSPFNYQEQALLAVPADLPPPTHPSFAKEAVEKIWEAIQASRGNTFVLFTSYSLLRLCYNMLKKRLEDNRYPFFKQGDAGRHVLIKKFREIDRSVLFGTDSFWEGVDVAGEALRCVVIVKLPFKVPSEPIIQARAEAIAAAGDDPFQKYSVPTAIVKFKQGFGRLIRKKRDRGCIVCLDTRLINKGYGKMFLNSLPNCNKVVTSGAEFKKTLVDFYRKTYHLTK